MSRLRLAGMLLLGGALLTPAVTMAQTEGRSTTTTTTTTETHRYYDPGYKEYHNWDANEDRAYHTYIQETHRRYTEFPKTTVTEQTEYWKWRHDHPDKVIQHSETTEERK